MRGALAFVTALLAAVLLSPGAGVRAQAPPIKIGDLMPLTGNAAVAGQSTKAAIEVGVQIVNGAYPDISKAGLAGLAGLSNLKGAKIEVIFADSQGNPSVGQSETIRLITQEHVVAITGAYQSAVTLPATQVSERYGTPWLVGDSSSPNITGRGFKWIFRATLMGPDLGRVFMDFLNDVNRMGHPAKTVTIVHENTEYGTSTGGAIRDEAKRRGFDVVGDISYNANGTDVSAEVLQLKEKNPDAVIFVSYTSDSILFMKTFKSLNYRPRIVMGEDAGFSDPAFAQNVGSIAQGAINRSAWSIGKPGSATYRINELYRARTGRDLDDNSSRNLQGFLVLADAINRAGSTQPEAIRKALEETNLSRQQLIIGYKGVRFDKTGQNLLAYTYITQLIGNNYVTVWPQSAQERALVWPFKGWQQ